MKALLRSLTALLAAGALGACASKIAKVDIPATAVPAEEIAKTEESINEGYAAQYDVIAPKEFRRAQSWLNEAKDDMRTGQGQQEILDDIGYARAWLDKTKERVSERQAKIQGLLDARQVAIEAGARDFPREREKLGELDDDLRDLADDDTISTEDFNRLQNAYFDVELNAIQDKALGTAQAKIAGARRDGARDNVPRTLRQAELDLANAYNVVAAHRHSPEGYKDAVDKANASAELLVEVLSTSKVPGPDLSEDVALKMVEQGRQLAAVKGQLTEEEKRRQQLSQNLDATGAQLTEAQAAAQLEAALESARKEFDKNEADVYREGDKLLIRLKSMNFASGRSDLPQESLPVLAKVKGIAEELGPQNIVVEGHTDSTGSKQLNQALSQKRAQAVAQYLETTGLEAEKIQTVGRGFDEPITSNKTKSGRAQNRRVDVIITPSNSLKVSPATM